MLKIDNNQCTGCGACVQTCPIHCIHLINDENGFTIPQIDFDVCINCNRCESVCQVYNKKLPNIYSQEAYAVVSKDLQVLKNSTSGGAFTHIANYVLKRSGTVYGCTYDKDLSPVHIRIDNFEDLPKLNGSKYIQSDTRKTFIEVKQDLENDILVLYSGTPCQIAGLYLFLGKKYDQLVTIDIICHGVPSSTFFRKFVKYLSMQNNAEITCVDFRSKKNRNWSLGGIYSGVKNNSGKHFEKNFNYVDYYYYYYFLKAYTYRDSCYCCKYASLSRPADFTLGDFWGIEHCNFDFKTSNGCSLVLLNTEKSQSIFHDLDIFSERVDINVAIRYNAQLCEPSKQPKEREKVLAEMKNENPEEINRIFKNRFRKDIFKGKLKFLIPVFLKDIILKINYK